MKRRLARTVGALILGTAACLPVLAQSEVAASSVSISGDQPSSKIDSPNAIEPVALVRVCRRPLPRWAASRNFLLKVLNGLVVRHLHHSYIGFSEDVFIPSVGTYARTVGIHPVGAGNKNKQPMLDQNTDNIDSGGECKVVRDATPEKVKLLVEEISADTCYSCGPHYHNRALSGCYNNSNTYVYDLITGAGMTPPKMKGAPGYRRHHGCHL